MLNNSAVASSAGYYGRVVQHISMYNKTNDPSGMARVQFPLTAFTRNAPSSSLCYSRWLATTFLRSTLRSSFLYAFCSARAPNTSTFFFGLQLPHSKSLHAPNSLFGVFLTLTMAPPPSCWTPSVHRADRTLQS